MQCGAGKTVIRELRLRATPDAAFNGGVISSVFFIRWRKSPSDGESNELTVKEANPVTTFAGRKLIGSFISSVCVMIKVRW